MSEIVLITDLMAGYRTDWARVAETESLQHLHIGDVLRHKGAGEESEALKVEAIKEAPNAQLYLVRGHRNTRVSHHPLGSVFEVIVQSETSEAAPRRGRPPKTAAEEWPQLARAD